MPVNTTAPAIIIYYTDHHDVDEDMAAILAQGGYWEGDVYVGVLGKVISTAPDLVDYIVASKKK